MNTDIDPKTSTPPQAKGLSDMPTELKLHVDQAAKSAGQQIANVEEVAIAYSKPAQGGIRANAAQNLITNCVGNVRRNNFFAKPRFDFATSLIRSQNQPNYRMTRAGACAT